MANYSINTLDISSDKHIFTLPYGVCGTAAGTAAKAVTVDTKDSAFELVTGAAVLVKFTYGNSIANSTLNVNGTGAKPIYRYGSTTVSTGDSTTGWRAGAVQLFVYDGTGWIRQFWENTTYSAATTSANGLMSSTDKTKLNNTNIAYGTCATAAATAAKVITVTGNTNWTLAAGSMITVLFSATNTAESPTFNVNGTGAKNVFYGASQITTGSLSYAGYANRPMNFMYDGTQYRFIGWGADSNTDTKVQQNAAITTAGEYPVILAYSTATSKVTNAVQKTSTLKYNPSTKILTVGDDIYSTAHEVSLFADIETALDTILGV